MSVHDFLNCVTLPIFVIFVYDFVVEALKILKVTSCILLQQCVIIYMTKASMRLGCTDQIEKAQLAGPKSKLGFLVEAVTNYLSALMVTAFLFYKKRDTQMSASFLFRRNSGFNY